MPTSITLDGSRIYRPGVYGIIDASALGGAGVSTGNVAVVGAFPTIEQNEPLTFTSARAVRDFDADDLDLQLIAKLAFAPSTDDRVPGGADTLTFVNVQGTTQASYPLAKDSTGADSLVLKSKLYGTKGNRTFAKLAVNASSATALDFTISRGSVTETFTALESGAVADFYHQGAQLTAATFSVSASQLLWSWRKDHVFVAGADTAYASLTETVVKNGTTLAVSMTDGAGGGAIQVGDTVTVTVTGLNAAGAAQTGTATITYAEFNADNNVSKVVQFSAADATWSTVTEISYAVTGSAFTGTVKVAGTAFDIDLTSDFDYVGQVVSYIANNAAQGWKADAIHPRIGKIPAEQMDAQSNVDTQNGAGVSSNKATARADLWAIVDGLSSSRLVTATRATSASRRPGPASLSGFTESSYFVGGSVSATNDADYDDALEAIENTNVQIVVPMSESLTVHKKMVQHCIDAALAGYERNAYVGAPKSQSLVAVFNDYASKLNSRHVALFAQEVQVENAEGELKYMAPMYGAVMLAGMQAGTAVATPLTFKRPNVFATRQNWDRNRDAGEAISKGIINLSSDNLGIRVERSVTTYLVDDNPAYSEVSANESINTSVRSLRTQLKSKIGDKVVGSTANKLKSLIEAQLQQQVRDGTIKAWQNIVMTDLGDRVDVSYEVAAVEPLNFIVITANVVRIASEV